ncbi:MAG: hypothetical protein KDA37_03570 [Planctomycetales bacterium]|nr:hypothetical protein [Planctomycetales bacterium]
MASEQVKTVLDNTRQYHARIGEHFATLASRCNQPRASMLLDYLSGHERDLAAAIDRIEEDTESKVLDTWVQSSEASTHLVSQLEREIDPPPDASFEDLVGWALRMDNRALQVYEDLALRSEPAWLREVFQQMYRMEQQEEKLVAVQTLRGMDL